MSDTLKILLTLLFIVALVVFCVSINPAPPQLGRYHFDTERGLAFDTSTGELYRLHAIAGGEYVWWVQCSPPIGIEPQPEETEEVKEEM